MSAICPQLVCANCYPLFQVGQPPEFTNLGGLLWQLPCTSPSSNFQCPCTNPADQIATLSGTPGRKYMLTLLFRGLMENSVHTGGAIIQQNTNFPQQTFTAAGLVANPGSPIYLGGNPSSDGSNNYSLSISNPPAEYYLNYWQACYPNAYNAVYGFRYCLTVPVITGAVITLHADGGSLSGGQTQVSNGPGNPVVFMNVLPAFNTTTTNVSPILVPAVGSTVVIPVASFAGFICPNPILVAGFPVVITAFTMAGITVRNDTTANVGLPINGGSVVMYAGEPPLAFVQDPITGVGDNGQCCQVDVVSIV